MHPLVAYQVGPAMVWYLSPRSHNQISPSTTKISQHSLVQIISSQVLLLLLLLLFVFCNLLLVLSFKNALFELVTFKQYFPKGFLSVLVVKFPSKFAQ